MNQKNTELTLDKRILIQKFITLGELCTGISHEMKNILVTVCGYCDLVIEKYGRREPIESDLVEIKKSSELARNIFMEFLNLSKSAEKTANKEPAGLNSIIDEVLVILSSVKRVKFEKKFDETIEPVQCSVQKIKQVCLNIIMNAIDSIAGTDGRVEIATGKLPFNFGYFIRIADNGCGMDEEVLKSLFRPFFTTKSSGTGLGLTVCRDIMREHNGTITAESVKGKGSSFYLVFLFDAFKPHSDIIDL